MSIAFVTRGIVLLVFAALAGLASSAFTLLGGLWSYGARSVLFGAVLGLGVLVTDRLSQERLRKGQYPDFVLALVVAVLTGIVAATVLTWHAQGFPPDLRRKSGWLAGGALLAVSVAYAVLLHGVYAARGLVKRPNLTVLLGAVAAGVLCGALRASLAEFTLSLPAGSFFIITAMAMMVSGVLFCLLWMHAVRITDPGWSPQRWAKSITEQEKR